ncbi:MAG: Bug family tripartite tricarboxylate transporter substrate binding protein [Vitreoscilla sp.]
MLASAVGAAGLSLPALRAAGAPSGLLRILVGSAAGSVMDVSARQIGEVVGAQTGQTVLVENRPSAGGIAALDALCRAAPDGQTVSLVHAMQMSAAPSLFLHLPYDPLRDFALLGVLFRGPQVLTLNPAVGVSSWPDLLRLVKSHPGRYRYSTPGSGTPQHLTMELIKATAGIDVQHIPYRGPAATAAVLSGEVDLMLEGVMPVLPYLRAGSLRAVAAGGLQRIGVLADVPTFEELGVAGIGTVWVGMVAPKATPVDLVQRLSAQLARAVTSPALRAAFESTGRTVSPGSPADMALAIRGETQVWRAIIQRTGITPD